GKVRGVFVRSAYDGTLDQAGLKKYIKTPRQYVWCAWQDGKVLVHVRMKNTSAEHVTVHWYPRYSIRAGGIHGDGFSSAQSSGFDSGEVRNLTVKQDPKGVKDNSKIVPSALPDDRERLASSSARRHAHRVRSDRHVARLSNRAHHAGSYVALP